MAAGLRSSTAERDLVGIRLIGSGLSASGDAFGSGSSSFIVYLRVRQQAAEAVEAVEAEAAAGWG